MSIIERINESIDTLERTQNKKTVRLLDTKLLRWIAFRFNEFSDDCKDCKTLLKDMDSYLRKLNEKNTDFDRDTLKDHFKRKSKYVAHLNRTHDLIQMGQNTGLWVSLGVSIGVVLGLTTFDNLALGIPIGMSIGLLIGTSKDALARKQGKVI
ncbi:MAG: hypothetical protein NUK57_09310 [Gudongella sp.]|nr:hypothetical protein [Gudongella sp.]